MLQLDEIGFRVETDYMRACNNTSSRRRYMQHFVTDLSFGRIRENLLLSVDCLQQDVTQSERGSAWAVKLLAMMNFLHVWIILRPTVHQFRSVPDNAKK